MNRRSLARDLKERFSDITRLNRAVPFQEPFLLFLERLRISHETSCQQQAMRLLKMRKEDPDDVGPHENREDNSADRAAKVRRVADPAAHAAP